MTIDLPPDIEQLVFDKVRSGRFGSATEVVAEAIRVMDQAEQTIARQVAELQARLDADIAALDRGEFADGEEFLGGLVADLDARHRRG